MTKTMSIRMDRDNYEFLAEISKEERSDLSKAVRDLVTRGRVLLAVERYRKGEASLGKAAALAGLPVGQMMTILAEFGVESRIEKEDYLQGVHNLAKVWCLVSGAGATQTGFCQWLLSPQDFSLSHSSWVPQTPFSHLGPCFIALLHPAATFSSRSSVSGYRRTSRTSAAA